MVMVDGLCAISDSTERVIRRRQGPTGQRPARERFGVGTSNNTCLRLQYRSTVIRLGGPAVLMRCRRFLEGGRPWFQGLPTFSGWLRSSRQSPACRPQQPTETSQLRPPEGPELRSYGCPQRVRYRLREGRLGGRGSSLMGGGGAATLVLETGSPRRSVVAARF